MQQENKSIQAINNSHYAELASLLVLFLHSPSPDLEHRLSLFPPQLYLQLILNPSEPKEIRQACCASFKAQILNHALFKPHAETVLANFETIHFTTDPKVLEDIEGAFAMLTEKLFQLYLDDEKKLQAFTNIMQRISNNTDIANAAANLRGAQLAQLLIRAMDPSTLNNQICIGQLICYFKQLYYIKNRTPDLKSVNGRGLQLLRAAMSQVVSEGSFGALLDLQVQFVKMIKEIIERLEVEEVEDGDCIPGAYIRNSDEIEGLFQSILCVSPDGKIYCENKKVNQLKAVLIGIFVEQFPYHVTHPFLLLCFSTIARCSPNALYDDVDSIISAVLQLLQRSTNHAAYAQYYYNNTQIMVIKLLELISTRESQLKDAENDPEHFIQLADDFCKKQESDSVKVRAGSLLYNLCLTIDGNLTFINNLIMIPAYSLEKHLTEQLMPDVTIRQLCLESAKGMKTLSELWSGTPEGLTDACLLLLSCLSDLIIKRGEFNFSIRTHINSMIALFQHRERILALLPPIIIARYIQLFSFFSFPGCLDVFLPFYAIKPLFAEAILNALQTVMQFHDKKSQSMCRYVSLLSTRILLLSDKLTPLLEQTILSRPELILCIKEKLVQKLVNWLLDFYDKENVFGCNKISNLLCKVIEQYPKFAVDTGQDFNFDLEALNAYLLPLYRKLTSSVQNRTAEQCLVDVAVQHVQCLGVRIQGDLLHRFVQMGIVVVEHNGCVLNKCLQLFSRTLSIPGMERNKEMIEFVKLRKVQLQIGHLLLPKVCQWLQKSQERERDRWQLLFLLEITIVTLVNDEPSLTAIPMPTLLHIFTSSKCEIVRLKVFQIWMLVMQLRRDDNCEASQCLQRFPIPEKLPPYQRNNFMIYLISTITASSNIQFKVYLLRALIKLYFPSKKDKEYISNYEAVLHCSTSPESETEIDAFQTVQSVLHPLNAMGTDTYTCFRSMYHQLSDWQQIRQLLAAEEQNLVREIMGHEMVGSKPRMIRHVKK